MFSESLYDSTAKWEISQIFKEDRLLVCISERDRRTLKRIVSINHRSTAAKVTAELNIHLEDCFHKNSLTRASQIQDPW